MARLSGGTPQEHLAEAATCFSFTSLHPGGHNDQAHPPIHPTAPFQADGSDKARLYEFICRHFLA